MQICLDSTLIKIFDQSSGKKLEENLDKHGLTTEVFLKMLKTKMTAPEMVRLIERKIKQCINEKEEKLAISFLTQFSTFINIEQKDSEGRTILLFAIQNQCRKVAKYLIKNNADLYVQDLHRRNVKDYATLYLKSIFSKLSPDLISPLLESIWLAHVWGLSGNVDLRKSSAPIDGFNGVEGKQRIAHMALSYVNHCKQLQMEHPFKEMSIGVIEKCLQAFYNEEDVVAQVKDNKPTIVKVEWDEHSAYVFFGRKKRVMRCNRGELCIVPGVRMYQMNSTLHRNYIVKELQKTDKFMNHRSFFRLLDLTSIKEIPQKLQSITNCTVASGNAVNYALYIDEALETYPDESTALAKAKIAYKDYTVYARLKTLEEYLIKSPVYDFALLKRIKNKIIDLENRKPYWKDCAQKSKTLKDIRNKL